MKTFILVSTFYTHVFDIRYRIAGAQTPFAFQRKFRMWQGKRCQQHHQARYDNQRSVQFFTTGFGETSTATPSLQRSYGEFCSGHTSHAQIGEAQEHTHDVGRLGFHL